MAVCPTCGGDIAHESAPCAFCAGETRLAGTSSRAGAARTATSSAGWLSSSGAIDHGRFPPGTVLGERYRIVGRLGRGGMGEVYRADDLKLGQPVALKFLPPDVDRDPARLMQLHTEVRMARQVSHPNVCRVYDIDEVDGHTFLSMEYVDGEDLGSLLKRIGRFPVDRATELAREICAGLAAAHERGVVHRDLKPANVMLDGSGKVRITDFGLAGAAGEALRAGTPAYMAPEQLAGAEVTAQSDIYALGLVLYELYTGQRAVDAKNVAELVRKREAGVAPPSQIVGGLDPTVDRAILRCLERDPAERPASALGVAAALPGGDPLAAALAAGETPSPEMVAAAGEREALGPVPALALLATVLASLALLAALADRLNVTGVVPLDKPIDVLVDRAQQIARSLGYTEPAVDSASGFTQSSDYIRFMMADGAEVKADRLASGRPPVLLFWHRTSPRELAPTGSNRRVSYADPPYVVSGMVGMVLDPSGRLVELNVVPPQVEEPEGAAPRPPDWGLLFAAADLNQSDFQPVTPAWTPRSHSDVRAAWSGGVPGWPEKAMRIEAAGYRGRPVFFQQVMPWTRPARMQSAPRTRNWLQQTFGAIVAMGVLFGAVLVARHNLKKGRGDRRGAGRLAAVVLGATFGAWLIGATHVADLNQEIGRFFDGTGDALWAAAMLWVLYIALEPYVRRFWPSTLVSWSRLVAGRVRDPRVGRDILIGLTFGTVVALIERVYLIANAMLGYGVPPTIPRVSDLEGMRQVLAAVGSVAFNAPFNALWFIFGMVLLRLVFRKIWVTAVAGLVLLTLTAGGSLFQVGPVWLGLLTALVSIALILVLVLRFGLLATTTFFFFNFMIAPAALTLDTSRWFFATSLWILAIGAALAIYGFYAARGGEPLLGRKMLD